MKPFTTVAVAVFGVMAIVHLSRLLMGWQVIVGEFAIPVWWSGPAVVVTAGLALMLWREARAH